MNAYNIFLTGTVGLTYVYFNPTLSQHGHSNSEDFYRQELPCSDRGCPRRCPVDPKASVRLEVSGGGLPRVDSGRTEGGTVYLRQINADAGLSLAYNVTRALQIDVGYHYSYFLQPRTSHEDDNAFLSERAGSALGLCSASELGQSGPSLLRAARSISYGFLQDPARELVQLRSATKGSPKRLDGQNLAAPAVSTEPGLVALGPARSSDKTLKNLHPIFRIPSGLASFDGVRKRAREGVTFRARCDVDPLGQRDGRVVAVRTDIEGTRRGVAGVGVRGPTGRRGGTCAMNGPAV